VIAAAAKPIQTIAIDAGTPADDLNPRVSCVPTANGPLSNLIVGRSVNYESGVWS
jgi:hypothetical protein